jgi:hypothetical protein
MAGFNAEGPFASANYLTTFEVGDVLPLNKHEWNIRDGLSPQFTAYLALNYV